ncbi:MAG: sigma-70 family RNA polymerase sigma factor [Oscillospiraceae bacterium]|nr:sigma-70 family RNA polymerase sigma factor [Oscillospiraceae bacterium]
MRCKRRKIAAWENLSPWAALKRVGGRIANEILMHFRAQRKCAQDVSLSDPIETGAEGTALELMEVIAEEGDLMERIFTRERRTQLRQAMDQCLTEQERLVIRLRYGLSGETPKRQREVAQITGLSRSYISRIEKRALEKLRENLEK